MGKRRTGESKYPQGKTNRGVRNGENSKGKKQYAEKGYFEKEVNNDGVYLYSGMSSIHPFNPYKWILSIILGGRKNDGKTLYIGCLCFVCFFTIKVKIQIEIVAVV